MKYIKINLIFSTYVFLIGLFLSAPLIAQDLKFTVVIDAGHGGHDPGAIGSISKEKDLNLAIALQLGNIIEQKYKDVKVVFSRKTDKYLTLQERADVVNDHHADLFICVHTNSAQSAAAYGAESFTLGLAKTKANLDVAMRENSVITLEENYKTKYQGFDPNSVDSYIMFEFMQDKYIDRSVEFASTIQKQFHSYCNRSDRGVRQAGFWVLHRSACPSVLIEVGFISNPAEERYLNSETGQKEMATAIFNAFVDYKHNHDKKSGRLLSNVSKIDPTVRIAEAAKPQPKLDAPTLPEVKVKQDILPLVPTKNEEKDTEKALKNEMQPKTSSTVNTTSIQTSTLTKQKDKKEIDLSNALKKEEEPKESKTDNEQKKPKASIETPKLNNSNIPVFKVQVLASAKSLKLNAPDFKGIKNVEVFVEGGFSKYTIGAETNYSKIEKLRKEISSKFPEAFIIAFVGNKKITAKEALKLIK